MPESFDPYHRWLAIPPKDQPPDHYRLLGLEPFESDVEVIRDAAEQRIAHVRTYQLGKHSELSQKVLNELAAAKGCLLDPGSKTEYDARLRSEPPALGANQSVGPASLWKKPVIGAMVSLAFVGLVVAAVVATIPRHPPEASDPAVEEAFPVTGDRADQNSPPFATTFKAPSRSSPPLAVSPFDAAKAKEHQEAWSKYLGEPVEVANSVGMKLILIPPGEYLMGSPDSQEAPPQEKPQHRARITKPFRLAAHEVTVRQFGTFAEATGYQTESEVAAAHGVPKKKGAKKSTATWRNPMFRGFEQTLDDPVVWISWNDAVQFCAWLSAKEGKTVRLPTEAEWEYAARAGTVTRFPVGDDPEQATQIGNLADAALKAKAHRSKKTLISSDGYVNTAPVGSFRPNAFGLYDMLGNVSEFCADWHNPFYFAESPENDPPGPAVGEKRVIRGSSWNDVPTSLASRYPVGLSLRNAAAGFRVVFEVGRPER